MSNNDLLVIMGCSRPNLMMPEYLRMLSDSGVDTHVETLDRIQNNDQGSLGDQIRYVKKFLDQFSDYKKIVMTDAWDVLFFGTLEDVYNKVPDTGILMAAERNLYPEPELLPQFSGNTPWKFVNGGMMCGSWFGLSEWVQKMESHPLYDPSPINQRWFNRRAAEADPIVRLDTQAHLFYCMYAEAGEMQFKDGKPWNSLTNTNPNFIHFNGRSPEGNFRAMWAEAVKS